MPDVDAKYFSGARMHWRQPGTEPQERRLSRTVWALKKHNFTRNDGQISPGKGRKSSNEADYLMESHHRI